MINCCLGCCLRKINTCTCISVLCKMRQHFREILFSGLLIIESTIAKSNYSWKNKIKFLKGVGGMKKVIARQKIGRPIKI